MATVTFWDGTTNPLQTAMYTEARYRNGSLYTSYTKPLSTLPTDQIQTVHKSGYTPDFHSKIREGKLVEFTERSVERRGIHATPGTFYGVKFNPLYPRKTCEQDHRVNVGASCAVKKIRVEHEEPAGGHEAMCLQEAAAKANSGAMMLMVEMAEGRKTVSLVRDAVKTVRGRVNYVMRTTAGKHKRLYKAADIFNAFGDTWLEARYGWNQLVYSTQDLVSAFDRLANPGPKIVMGKSAHTENAPGTVTHVDGEVTYWSLPYAARAKDVQLENSLITRAIVAHKVSSTSFKAVDRNLAAFAWEIVPYSFVVDWFFNVGDLFRAHWPVPEITQTVAATSRRRTVAVDVTIEGCSSSGCVDEPPGDSQAYYHAYKESYDRSPWTGGIPVSLTWRPRLGWKNVIDMITLIPGRKQLSHLYRTIRL